MLVMEHDDDALYTPLDESKREIRLVKFSGVDSGGYLSCSLSTANLGQSESAKLQYITLSYLWGDAKQTEPILVNGQLFQATTNLVALFRHYESIPAEYRDLPTWIDAICINQDNVEERTSQLRMMGDIFRNATASVSWLGVSSEDSRLGMSTISMCVQYVREATGESKTDWLMEEQELLCAVDFMPPSGEALPRNKAWAAVSRFLKRPYWKRSWMYQEIVLPPRIVILCGNETLSLDDLLVFIEWMRSIKLNFGHTHIEKEVFYAFPWPYWLTLLGIGRLGKHVSNRKKQHAYSAPQHDGPQDIVAMIPVGLTATDPRDVIYGILGALPIPVVPDYNKSVEDVYIEFTTYLIAVGQLSSVLSQRSDNDFQHRKNNEPSTRDSDFPSWVPDYSVAGFRDLGVPTPFAHADSINANAEVWIQGMSKSFKLEACGTVLRVSGVVCDQIIEEPKMYYLETALTTILKFLWGWNCNGVKRYATGVPIHQALVKTLLKDRDHLKGDYDSYDTSANIMAGTAFMVFESMFLEMYHYKKAAPKPSAEDIFAFWYMLGFKYGSPTFEELEIMLFGRRLTDREGLIPECDDESYVDNRRAMVTYLAVQNQEFMFQTNNGYIGFAEGEVKPTDQVCVLFGCEAPVVLRRVGAYYRFIGVCYVLGFMEGEAIQLVKDGKRRIEAFEIR